MSTLPALQLHEFGCVARRLDGLTEPGCVQLGGIDANEVERQVDFDLGCAVDAKRGDRGSEATPPCALRQRRGTRFCAIEAAQQAAETAIVRRPEGIDVTAALDVARQSQARLVAAVNGRDAKVLAVSLQDYVDAVRALRSTMLDASQLSLDPEQATFYLMNAASTVASDVVESISRSRGMAGAAGARK